MNGEAKVLKADTVIFPMKPPAAEVSEIKSDEIKKAEVSIVGINPKESRFARLKRSLRKRSASIL